MSGDVLTIGNLGNPKHKAILRHISDVFDNHRGNITDNIALTKFKTSSNHIILFNSLTPELNGKRLISVEDSDGSVLYAPIDIQSIICSDKNNNNSINVLIDKYDKNHVWEAISNDKIIKLLLRLDESEGSEKDIPNIAGFSIKFADSVRTKYRVGITMVNSSNETISQIANMDSSFETNNTQFFQFSTPVEGSTRIIVELELVGTNIYEWKLNNITLYNYMNEKSLKSLADGGIITYSLVPNNVFVRESKDEILKIGNEEGDRGKTTTNKTTVSPQQQQTSFEHSDSYGTPLLSAPDLSHQFIDRVDEKQITKIANIKKLYSITDLKKNGRKVYTFETDPNTKNLTLTFSPTDDINKHPDEPVTDMEKLVNRGYIKKGGFKNYSLTFYIKLDQITMQDQYLTWKYGGWLFNDQFPELSRSTDVYIPITSDDPRPRVFTEYVLNNFREIKENIVINGIPAPILSDGKWIGFQFTRHVDDETKSSTVDIDINLNPTDEEGNFTNLTNFQPFLHLEDISGGEEPNFHQANVWSGISELVSVSGAKYVSLFGLSLYELEK